MKKRKIVRKTTKRKTSSPKKCKMNLIEKEFAALTVFLVIMFAALLIFANPTQNATITSQVIKGIDVETSGTIGTALTDFINPENADPVVVKWIMFFSFALLIWGFLSMILGKRKGGILKLLSLPIAFAMVYLLKPEEIFAGLIGYSALGMTILVVVPFVAIIFSSIFILRGRLNAPKIITQLMIWYFYAAFMIYFLVRAFFSIEIYSLGILVIIGIALLTSIIIIWKNKPWRALIARLEREGIQKALEDVGHAGAIEDKTRRVRGEEAWKHVGEMSYS